MSSNIDRVTRELERHYPSTARDGSKAALYEAALRDDIVTQDIVDEARDVYGSLWCCPRKFNCCL